MSGTKAASRRLRCQRAQWQTEASAGRGTIALKCHADCERQRPDLLAVLILATFTFSCRACLSLPRRPTASDLHRLSIATNKLNTDATKRRDVQSIRLLKQNSLATTHAEVRIVPSKSALALVAPSKHLLARSAFCAR